MRSILSTHLTKESVLGRISQVSIFSTYLGIPAEVIKTCIETGELICNPLRTDIHPTAGFRYNSRGKLKFRDFGNDRFWGDCFDIVALVMAKMYRRPYNVNNGDDFYRILRHITFTFQDIFFGKEKDTNLINGINTAIEAIRHTKPVIEVVVRGWDRSDMEYWGQFGIGLRLLNLNFVYPVEQFYINRSTNPEPRYYYDRRDPCYAYNLGRDRHGIDSVKLYFPRRKKGLPRFITNCNHLEGIYNLDGTGYDYIVVTKSTKDRLALAGCINGRLSYGVARGVRIGFINIPCETYRLRQNEYDWLAGKLSPHGKLVSLMDNDRTGMREAVWLRDFYHIVPVIIPNALGAKDFAELVSKHKDREMGIFVEQAINYIDNYDWTGSKSVWNTEEYAGLPY